MVPENPELNPPEDQLDRLAKSAQVPEPPEDLLGRCLSSVPKDGSAIKIARWLQGEPVAVASKQHPEHPVYTKPPKRHRLPEWAWAAVAAAALLLVVGTSAWLTQGDSSSPVVENGPNEVETRRNFELPEQQEVPSTQVADNSTDEQPSKALQGPLRPAVPTEPAKLIPLQLAAGEIAPAIDTAKRVESIKLRDQYLAQIAVAQAQVGDYAGSVDTIGLMQDDAARTQALQGLSQGPLGAAGGGPRTDYESLINLVTETVANDTWSTTGGPGTIRPFAQGVYVDAQGLLNRQLSQETDGWLAELRASQLSTRRENSNARASSHLRKISLTRLEKFAQLRAAKGLPADEEMLTLAGLQRIEYVFVYPESGDVVIAGPAGDWKATPSGDFVSTETGRPSLLLDDLVASLRYARENPGQPFGCSIDPRQENLAKYAKVMQQYVARPRRPSERKEWMNKMRDAVGKQDIRYIGPINPALNIAHTLVQADYHMKLVGIGLEDSTVNVPSYLDLLSQEKKAPANAAIRCWFTLNYDAVLATKDLHGFHLRGQGVQVQSEDVLLTEQGQKVHTGKANALNQAFAQNFTQNFGELAAKYPIYAKLQNTFDMALASALIHAGNLGQQVGWEMSYFGNRDLYEVQELPPAQAVESVVNSTELNGGREAVILVSGGVHANPWKLVQRDQLEIDTIGQVNSSLDGSVPHRVANDAWWWD